MRRYQLSAVLCLVLIAESGCSAASWKLPVFSKQQQPNVLEPTVSKEEIVDHLNKNIIGLVSWRSGNARVQLSGAPVPIPPLPTSIAVEAPRNMRLIVSHPVTGGPIADLGSNRERFWVWSMETRQLMTARHDDIPLVLEYLQLPVQIDPDWLLEAFGVIPLDASKLQLERTRDPNQIELVSIEQSARGDTERVLRVDLAQGVVTERLLRTSDGEMIARAMFGKHTQLPSGHVLPILVKLEWPETDMEMTIHLGTPEPNSPALAQNMALWQLPRMPGTQLVDLGLVARARQRDSQTAPAGYFQQDDGKSGRAQLKSPSESNPSPFSLDIFRDRAQLEDAPNWAKFPPAN